MGIHRKLVICLLVVLMLWAAKPGACLAAEQEVTTIEVESAGIQIQVPADCYVLQQDMTEDDPYIVKMGGNIDQIRAYFEEAGIVLNVLDAENDFEVVVTMNQNQNVNYIYNMQSLDESQIAEFAETICETYKTYGYEVEGYEIYETDSAKYVLLNFGQTSEEGQVACRQFYTIRGTRIYNYTLRSYLGEITSEMETMMTNMMEHVVYLEQEMISFEDRRSGVSFSLPQGWEQITTSEQDTYAVVQYMHNNGLGESIQLLCIDLWGNLDVFRQFLTTRAQLDLQDEPTVAQIEQYRPYIQQFFSTEAELELRQIGENWYIISQEPLEMQTQNLEGVYHQNSVVMIREGVIYAFQYGYYEGSNLHEADFEALLNTVTYEEPSFFNRDELVYQQITNTAYIVLAVVFLLLVVGGVAGFLYISKTFHQE